MEKEIFDQLPERSKEIYLNDKFKDTPEDVIVMGAAAQIATECYQDIQKIIKFYMDIPQNHRRLISLWIVGTYMHRELPSYPFLFLNAMKGSGKSRLLRIIETLAWRGKILINPTEAGIFRSAGHNTIILDEAENISSKEKSTLRQLLNSAYKKGSTVERLRKVVKPDGEDYEKEVFTMFTPIALANINGMDEVLGDRCISLILEKSSDPSKIKLLEDFLNDEKFKEIRLKLSKIQESLCRMCMYGWSKNIYKRWNNYISIKYNTTYTTLTTLTTLTTPEINDDEIFRKIDALGIDGRNLELFFPLFSVALALNPQIFDEMLELATEMVAAKRDEDYIDSPDVAVFEFISMKEHLTWYNMTDLTIQFREFFVSDGSSRDWLNNVWLGKCLKRLGLALQKKRKARGVEVLLDISKAKEKIKMFGGGQNSNVPSLP